jgi:bifunctional DNA-binding transcriptional regulator/antitoxin component of YhaV-PrlF toxin-antitoxin module
MPRVKVRDLADEIRKALNVAEEDYLETELIEGVVLLRPASSSDEARRRLDEAIGAARYVGPEPRPSPEEEEEWIDEQLEAFRRNRTQRGP